MLPGRGEPSMPPSGMGGRAPLFPVKPLFPVMGGQVCCNTENTKKEAVLFFCDDIMMLSTCTSCFACILVLSISLI